MGGLRGILRRGRVIRVAGWVGYARSSYQMFPAILLCVICITTPLPISQPSLAGSVVMVLLGVSGIYAALLEFRGHWAVVVHAL